MLVPIISSSLTVQPTNAQVAGTTLSQTLNTIIGNVDWTAGNSWTSNWAIILDNQPDTAFDDAIVKDIARGDYLDALYVARIAELSGYSSETISQNTQIALEQIAMCGSLPITANANSYGDPDLLNSGTFLVYHRFALWGYDYASDYGLDSKWNENQAFTDIAAAYDKKPIGSVSGEMLWVDPQENWAKSYSSRYYDEHAQTLSTFLKLAQQGVPNALTYADKAWAGIQAHWNTRYQYYGYTGTTVVECAMGNFAQVIAEYKDLKGGTIPYWDRVIQDLNYKLLAKSWSSPGWATPGVIIHAANINNELRLWETMGAAIALQTQYPYFTETMKSNWANMLKGSTSAWQGLVASNLNNGGFFKGTSNTPVSNEATAAAAATLFLYGIVPEGGNLNIPNREEYYNDLRTPFSTQDFKFDYANQMIKIPVNAGKITFIYGDTPVSYTFPTNGVYTIYFSEDWNNIIQVNDTPIVTNPPSAPTNLEAAAGNAQVTLSWTTPSDNGGATITGYNLYKGTQPGQETEVITLGTANTYVDTAVTNDQTYYYYITATNSAGESTSSNEASATPTTPVIKTMTVELKTDKATYTKGSTVKMTLTAKDTTTEAPMNGATATVTVYAPNGKATWTGTGTIDSNGITTFDYKLPMNAQKGTYTIKATVSSTGYETATAQITFKV